MRRTLFLVASLLAPAFTVHAGPAPEAGAAAEALDWFLRTQMRADGSVASPGFSEPDREQAALRNVARLSPAAAALGRPPSAWAHPGDVEPLEWWRAHAGGLDYAASPNPTNDAAYEVLALASLGEDARTFGGVDHVERLITYYQRDGEWEDPATTQDDRHFNQHPHALLALRALGHSESDPRVAATTGALLARQNLDGGWNFIHGERTSAVDDTAMVAIALLTTLPAEDPAIERALSMLSAAQLPDGGFLYRNERHAESTAIVLEAALAAGEDPTAGRWRKPAGDLVDDLLKYAKDDGSFASTIGGTSDELPTTLAMRALAGAPLPVVPPRPAIAATAAVAGRPVALEASADLPVGRVVRWSWSFGDGGAASGASVTHVWSAPGAYDVRLTATTDRHVARTAVARVEVAPAGAIALAAPATVLRNETFTVVGSAPEAVRWRFDWGDGTAAPWSTAETASHAYGTLGTREVRAEAEDAEGFVTSAVATVRVVNAPPTLAAPSARTVDRTAPVAFDASASDADGPAPTLAWTFADGVVLRGARVERRFDALGEVAATVEARDADGALATQPLLVRIVNVPPTATLEAPPHAVVGERVTLRASASDPDGAAPALRWNDGATGAVRDVAFDAPGDHLVAVEAVDADGAVASAAAVVRVRAADAPAPTGSPLALAAGLAPEAPKVGDAATLALDVAGGRAPYAFRVQRNGVDVPVTGGRADLGLVDASFAWSAWVTDADGVVARTSGRVLPAAGSPPLARLDVSVGALEAAADAGESADPDGRPLLFRFDWGDGPPSEWRRDARVEHTYEGDGAYLVTVTVRDAEGSEARASRTVLARAPAEEPVALASVVEAPPSTPSLVLGPVVTGARPAPPASLAALAVALAAAAALRRRARGA